MNKLEEYRNTKSEVYKHEKFSGIPKMEETCKELSKADFKNGFDAAIALDLPIKFATWLYTEYVPMDLTMGEKYQYWLNNVFKIE